MLNQAEMKKKLRTQSEIFEHHLKRRDYWNATLIRKRTSLIAVFLEAEEEIMEELFGNREKEIEGLFVERKVSDAELRSIKAGLDTQKMGFNEVINLWQKNEHGA